MHQRILSWLSSSCTYVVGILAVFLGEVRWTPASDGHLAQPLSRRHNDGEEREEQHGVAAAETVHETVAAAYSIVVLPQSDL